MSDGSLSQDEIDALLQGSGGLDFDDTPAAAPVSEPSAGGGEDLPPRARKAFQNVMSGTVGSQQSNMGMVIGKSVTLAAPSVEVVNESDLVNSLPEEVVQVRLDFDQGVQGDHGFLVPTDLATTIAAAMMNDEGTELDDAAVSALEEGFSQIAGPILTAIGEAVDTTVTPAPASADRVVKSNLNLPSGSFVKLTYPITVEGGTQTQLFEYFAMPIVTTVAQEFGAMGGGGGAAAPAASAGAPAGGGGGADPFAGLGFGGGGGGGGGAPAGGGGGGGPSVQPVQFPDLQGGGKGGEHGNIGLLMDVYMEMTVELGRTRKLIKEILGMGEGTIIELDKLAGEPVDILVNHKLIAKGEVVVIDENFGVRVTEIVSPMDRVNSMT